MFILCTVSHVKHKPNWLFYLLRACAHFQFRLSSSEVFSAFLMHETHSTHSLAQMFIDAKTTEENKIQISKFNFTFSSIISVFDLFVSIWVWALFFFLASVSFSQFFIRSNYFVLKTESKAHIHNVAQVAISNVPRNWRAIEIIFFEKSRFFFVSTAVVGDSVQFETCLLLCWCCDVNFYAVLFVVVALRLCFCWFRLLLFFFT